MKTIKNLLSILVIFASLTLVSCENEPIDPSLANNTNSGGNSGNVNVNGTYKLTAFNSSIPTDLNNNGTSSTNQMNEHTCFNDMFLTLNSNHTFNADSRGIEINLAGTGTECYTEPDYNGTWVQNGNTVTLTYVDSGVTYNDNLVVSGNTLSLAVAGGEVIGLAGGLPVYIISNIQIVYTKQ